VVADAEWAGLTRALQHPEWLDDARFQTPAGRIKHLEARLELTAEVLKTRTSAEWLERLDAEQVPCAPVLSREEVITNAQVAANELIVESDHPYAGRMRQPRPAARFDRTPSQLRRPAPLLGEHTDAVLTELGISLERLAELRAAGVVA
jgi:crotonobetainyl-CoA:carnitine CoA-transferase CaiB-like acyl-CoA transferase